MTDETSGNPPGDENENEAVADPAYKFRIDVSDSIDEAQLLVAYVARTGQKFDEKFLGAIVDSQRTFGTSLWTKDAEEAFWKAFNSLAASVKPITITSLKDNEPKYGRIRLSSRLLFVLRLIRNPRRLSEAEHAVSR